MAKYLFQVSYNAEGVKELIQEGGTKRREAVEQFMSSMGGRLEAMYFAFGETDAYVIADVPDHVNAVAGSLAVNVRGAVNVKTAVLITPEEMDEAVKRARGVRPPGG